MAHMQRHYAGAGLERTFALRESHYFFSISGQFSCVLGPQAKYSRINRSVRYVFLIEDRTEKNFVTWNRFGISGFAHSSNLTGNIRSQIRSLGSLRIRPHPASRDISPKDSRVPRRAILSPPLASSNEPLLRH